MTVIHTVGHGALTSDAFAALLGMTGIELVVDIRRYPGSRRHPQFGQHALRARLRADDIAYRWIGALGGRREMVAPSPNSGLPPGPFRAYADHMAGSEFAGGVDELTDLAEHAPTAILCAESDRRRCHRSLLADHLVLVGEARVEHCLHDGSTVGHQRHGAARRVDDHVVYDLATPIPLFAEPFTDPEIASTPDTPV